MKIKSFLLLCVMSSGFGLIDFLLMANDVREQATFCAECGSPVRVSFASLYKSNGTYRLLCKKCLKKIRGKNSQTSSLSLSPSPSLVGFDMVFDSPLSSASLSPITPLPASPVVVRGATKRSASVPITFFIDDKKTAELAEFIVQQRLKKKIPLEKNVLESYGYPKNFDEALSLKIHLFERLYEASIEPEEVHYRCTLHHTKRCADIVDPQGNEHFYTVDGAYPVLFKRGSVFVFTGADSLEIKDLKEDRSYSFPVDTLPLSVLRRKCQDYGFEKVEPLSAYQEAELIYQRRMQELPSPDFTK